jgi:hypothetical protein
MPIAWSGRCLKLPIRLSLLLLLQYRMYPVLTVPPTNGLIAWDSWSQDDPRLLYVDATRGLSALTRPCVFTAVWEEINLTCGRQRELIIWLCFITAWLFIGFRDAQINVQKIKIILSNVFFFPFLNFFLLTFPPSVFSFTIIPYLFSSRRGPLMVAQWLRSLVQFQMVSLEIFRWYNPSDRTMALGSTQPLTEMSTRSIS